ncbi:MAG: hypothetical protein HYT65_01360, partial [Candidatus Yanofskybacteria bacterium]|nr:hypothetical protein [Candidatus Yanofskybacteria bacterium]
MSFMSFMSFIKKNWKFFLLLVILSVFVGQFFNFSSSSAQVLEPKLLIKGESSEVSGTTNGSAVTPTVGSITGLVDVDGTGSVNFAPAQIGNGVFFRNCCTNASNAYYKFTGSQIGNIFNSNEGEISFYLKSQKSWAERKTGSFRVTFNVEDNPSAGNLFSFLVNHVSGRLIFSFKLGETGNHFYYVPQGQEDTLFGNGVTAKVRLAWDATTSKLYINDEATTRLSEVRTPATPAWSASSVFLLGADNYLTYGGYNSFDDIIDEFTVLGPVGSPSPSDTTSPSIPTGLSATAVSSSQI